MGNRVYLTRELRPIKWYLIRWTFSQAEGIDRVKSFFAPVVSWWNRAIMPMLVGMGIWGAFLIGAIDSSSVPVPIDAFLALAVWNDRSRFWLYPMLAAAGSAVGGLVPYWLGRGGGELFLLKRISRERLEGIRARFERQEFLAVLVPSMLPPPTPWKLFVFAAGVFEMRVVPFLLAVFCGRTARWMVLAILVIKLGPGAVDLVAHHAVAVIVVVGGLAVGGFLWWWFRMRRRRRALGM
jgi:membrane protein YqaA with SNARE-associated domain